PGTLLTPRLDKLPVLGKLHDASVGVAAVPIGYEDVAIGRDSYVARAVESISPRPSDSGLSNRHQDLALGTDFDRLLALPILSRLLVHQDVAVAIEGESVGLYKHPRPETLY